MDVLEQVWWAPVGEVSGSVNGQMWYVKAALDKELGVFHVMITDMVVCYADLCDTKELEGRIQLLNPRLEGDTFELAKNAMLLVKNKTPVPIDVDSDDSLIIEYSQSIHAKLPFTWKFLGQKCDPEIFYKHVTSVLINLISQYERRETSLVKLLETKDNQIYKYAAASNLALNTASSRFSASEWSNNDINSEECAQSLEKIVDVPTAFSQGSVPYSQLMKRKAEIEQVSACMVDDEEISRNDDDDLPATLPLDDFDEPRPTPVLAAASPANTNKTKKRKKDLRL